MLKETFYERNTCTCICILTYSLLSSRIQLESDGLLLDSVSREQKIISFKMICACRYMYALY